MDSVRFSYYLGCRERILKREYDELVGFLKLVQNEIPELLEKVVGIRQTTPFYAILFGKKAVKYMRCVERGAYAGIVYKNAKIER